MTMSRPDFTMPVHATLAPPDFDAWDDLLALLRSAFAYMDGRIDPPSSLGRMGVAELRAKAREEVLLIVTDGDRLVGCAFAAVRPDSVYVGKVAVADAARRKGVARALMDAAADVARRAGRDVLELQTRIELVENHRTFAALGFVKTAETAHAGYGRPTSITMRRRVAAAT